MKKFDRIKEYIQRHRFILLIIVILGLFFIILEIAKPYFFFQDDNRTLSYPYMVKNMRAIREGYVPHVNFRQYLSIPYAGASTNGFYYIPAYVGMIISKALFAHTQGAVDVICIVNLIIGAVGFYLFISSLGYRKKAAFISALLWGLGSFNVYLGSSWYIIPAIAAGFPFMLLLTHSFIKKPTISSVVILGLTRALVAATSNFHMLVYGVFFEFIFALTALYLVENKNKSPRRFWKFYIPSLAVTVVVLLPLITPMRHLISMSFSRSREIPYYTFSLWSYDLKSIFLSLAAPFGRYNPRHSQGLPLPYLLHVGYAGFAGLIISAGWLVKNALPQFKKGRREAGDSNELNKSNAESTGPALERLKKYNAVFLLFAGISLLITTNALGPILFKIPIVNRFRWPFKLAFYLQFFIIAAAAAGMHRFFCWKRIGGRMKQAAFVMLAVAVIVNFGILYFACPVKSLKVFKERVPYNEPLKGKLKNGRLFTAGFSRQEYAFPTLGYNFATLWKMDHFAGYEPLLPKENYDATLGITHASSFNYTIPIEYLQDWGVRYYVVSNNSRKQLKRLENKGMVVIHKDKQRTVFEDPGYKPVVCRINNNSSRGIDWQYKANSIIINVKTEKPSPILTRILYNPLYKAYLDGKPAKMMRNRLNQMIIVTPPGVHEIEIRYEDPYFKTGLATTSALAIIAILAWMFFGVKLKKKTGVTQKKAG